MSLLSRSCLNVDTLFGVGHLDIMLFDPCIELGTKVCKSWCGWVEVNYCLPCSLSGMDEIKYYCSGGILAQVIHGLSIIICNSTVCNGGFSISSSATGREWIDKTCIHRGYKVCQKTHEINVSILWEISITPYGFNVVAKNEQRVLLFVNLTYGCDWWWSGLFWMNWS